MADQIKGFKIPDEITDWHWHQYYNGKPKVHTIRSGNRFKVGDKFSPRVWSGKPYASKQITIAPDIEIKKIFTFQMQPSNFIDECKFYINGKLLTDIKEVSKNDGLDPLDFVVWFAGAEIMSNKRKSFNGQIICWDDKINY